MQNATMLAPRLNVALEQLIDPKSLVTYVHIGWIADPAPRYWIDRTFSIVRGNMVVKQPRSDPKTRPNLCLSNAFSLSFSKVIMLQF